MSWYYCILCKSVSIYTLFFSKKWLNWIAFIEKPFYYLRKIKNGVYFFFSATVQTLRQPALIDATFTRTDWSAVPASTERSWTPPSDRKRWPQVPTEPPSRTRTVEWFYLLQRPLFSLQTWTHTHTVHSLRTRWWKLIYLVLSVGRKTLSLDANFAAVSHRCITSLLLFLCTCKTSLKIYILMHFH